MTMGVSQAMYRPGQSGAAAPTLDRETSHSFRCQSVRLSCALLIAAMAARQYVQRTLVDHLAMLDDAHGQAFEMKLPVGVFNVGVIHGCVRGRFVVGPRRRRGGHIGRHGDTTAEPEQEQSEMMKQR